jgi:HPt (histidine-containing phosphotransfer) domain-containing protein
MEDQVIIDRNTFNDLKDLMGADFIVELIDTYFQETSALIEQLHQALEAGDAVSFGRYAHSIKSSSASLGALNFSQQAREMEMLGKAGDLLNAEPKLERLAAEFPAIQRCLEELRNEP